MLQHTRIDRISLERINRLMKDGILPFIHNDLGRSAECAKEKLAKN